MLTTSGRLVACGRKRIMVESSSELVQLSCPFRSIRLVRIASPAFVGSEWSTDRRGSSCRRDPHRVTDGRSLAMPLSRSMPDRVAVGSASRALHADCCPVAHRLGRSSQSTASRPDSPEFSPLDLTSGEVEAAAYKVRPPKACVPCSGAGFMPRIDKHRSERSSSRMSDPRSARTCPLGSSTPLIPTVPRTRAGTKEALTHLRRPPAARLPPHDGACLVERSAPTRCLLVLPTA